MNRLWEIKEPDNEFIDELISKYKLSRIVAVILYNRGIRDINTAGNFLSYNDGKFFSPFLFSDCKKSCELIKDKIEKNEKIAVFGDYDVDGITSVSIFYDFFTKLLKYKNVDYVLPDRDEGYGLNNKYIDKMKENGVTLLITVDCGICNIDEIKYASENGICTIVTDHHEVPSELPEAFAIINPKAEEDYPFDFLAGVGVAFKLIHGYILLNNLNETFLDTIIDLVALGTVSDIVPLLSENRLITKKGLDVMKKRRRPGIDALMDYVYGNDINSRTISYGIAPRINASGRVGNPEVALELLITEDPNKASFLAERLNSKNIERQNIERGIFENAQSLVDEDVRNQDVILLSSSDWNIGVIGIVSSKLKDKYNRPAFLISIDENTGMGKGSARSVNGYHLVDVLTELSDLIEAFGGHEFAAGFSIKKDNIDKFHDRLIELYRKNNGNRKMLPVIQVDSHIKAEELNISLYDEIYQKVFPFGEKNPFPVFCMRNIKVKSLNYFGNKHISLWITDGFYNLKAVYYNFLRDNSKEDINRGDDVDIVFTPKLSFFRNESFIELQIVDYINRTDKKNSSENIINVEKYHKKGNEFLFTGNFERALECYFKALKFEKNDAKLYFNIGITYKKKGDKGKAIKYLHKAKKLSFKTDEKVYKRVCSNIKKIKNGRMI